MASFNFTELSTYPDKVGEKDSDNLQEAHYKSDPGNVASFATNLLEKLGKTQFNFLCNAMLVETKKNRERLSSTSAMSCAPNSKCPSRSRVTNPLSISGRHLVYPPTALNLSPETIKQPDCNFSRYQSAFSHSPLKSKSLNESVVRYVFEIRSNSTCFSSRV